MKILISGLCGHMGGEVARLAQSGMRGVTGIFGVDAFADISKEKNAIPCAGSFSEAEKNVNCIIDFSHHDNTQALLDFAVTNKIPLVLATTGQTDAEKEMISAASRRIPLFFSANYSLGVALLIELAKKTASLMPDAEIEIVEAHHDRKVDAPSGTALAIADAIKTVRPNATKNCGRSGQGKRTKEEIGIHAIRMGNIVGMHEVIIGTESQTITLKHEAHSRALFAEGALAAAEYLMGKPIGLYDMKSMVDF